MAEGALDQEPKYLCYNLRCATGEKCDSVTLEKPMNFSEPQFPCVQVGVCEGNVTMFCFVLGTMF